jgi:hypothetical protein
MSLPRLSSHPIAAAPGSGRAGHWCDVLQPVWRGVRGIFQEVAASDLPGLIFTYIVSRTRRVQTENVVSISKRKLLVHRRHNNQQLFSDHYLNVTLPGYPEWKLLAHDAAQALAPIAPDCPRLRPER